AHRAVALVDETFQLFDNEAPVKIGFAALAVFRIEGRRILIDSVLARVIDSDDYQGVEFASADQPLRGRVHAPFDAAERSSRVKQVLPVVHIQNPVTPGCVGHVSRRQVNDYITAVVEESRFVIVVISKLSHECMIKLQTLPLECAKK